jgi:acyl-CoA synthetase (AMP-forming)/AMP-acid ligase II
MLAANGSDTAAAIVGAMLAGATVVPLPASDRPARLERMLARAKVAAIYAEGRSAKTARELAPGTTVFGAAEIDAVADPTMADVARHDSDPAAIYFTSGSTGEPRGVVLSHRNIIANTTSILASVPIRETDRIMAVLPFYYSFGASVLFTHVRRGACVVINNRFMFADQVLEEMIKEECTSLAGVPSTYQLLLRRSSLPKMTFPHLRYVQQAGGRLPPNFVRELDNVALGYLDEPEATAESFRDGALYTGDLGFLDADGFFTLVDRAKDFIKCAGYRVSMKEIEDIIVAFDGMIEAAVVGIPDELQGEAVQAFVVHSKGEAVRGDLEAFYRKALATHLQPKITVFLEALPKTAAGKLARASLRAMLRAE